MKKTILYIFLIIAAFSQLNAKYWERVDIPTEYADRLFLDVYFLESNPNYGWICGFGGHVLRTTNRGQTWNGTEIPGTEPKHLESIHFANQNVGYVSGPAGVFKSINGGASWTEVSPPSLSGLWGVFFLSEDYGVAVGGGCALELEFWHTTDGAASWNQFTVADSISGLTDAILYPSGLGFATSSGIIWKTLDSGKTWQFFANSGTNVWQEELSRVKNSFLVPYAGTSCSGNSLDGGMRFSSDNGSTWNTFRTGMPMYGCFLNSKTEGWACGVNRLIFYTNNSGQDWDLRNCGIEGLDLDDIWFISKDEGWVVGDGVYKLSDPVLEVDKQKMDFQTVCKDEALRDTIFLKSKSFFKEDVQLQMKGQDQFYFNITKPNSSDFNIRECGNDFIVIEPVTSEAGLRTATLDIIYKPGEPEEAIHSVELLAEIIKPTIELLSEKSQIDSIYCNTKLSKSLRFRSENDSEFIDLIRQVNKNDQFQISDTTPKFITTEETNINYQVTLKDTGYSQVTYEFSTAPCDTTFTVDLKAYGISPIIIADTSRSLITDCFNELLDTIEIKNTGNHELIIPDLNLTANNSAFEITGWKDGSSLPKTIKQDSSGYLIIRYSPSGAGDHSARLIIENNDSTKARGDKNPYIIDLKGTNNATDLSSKIKILDLGEICPGEMNTEILTLYNYGSINANIAKPANIDPAFDLELTKKFPLLIPPVDSTKITVSFQSDEYGVIKDTVEFFTEECGEKVSVILKGEVLSNEVNLIPDELDLFIKTGKEFKTNAELISNATIDLTITDISFVPDPAHVQFSISPAPDFPLNEGSSQILEISILPERDTTYNGNIIITAEGQCDTVLTLPLRFISTSRLITSDKDKIDFGYQKCIAEEKTESITYENQGTETDTITVLELKPQTPQFQILNKPQLPYYLDANKALKIDISFDTAEEGFFNSSLIMQTKEPNGQKDTIPLSGEFRKVTTEPKDTLIDAGRIELCEDLLEYEVSFSNSGTLTDTLELIEKSNSNIINQENLIVIESAQTDNLNFTVDPPDYIQSGFYQDSLVFRSKVCGDLHKIYFNIEIIRPRLTFNPKNLSFNKLWVRDTVIKQINASNNTQTPKQITDILLQGNDKNKFTILTDVPLTIQPGNSENISVMFTDEASGQFNSQMVIIEKSVCIDSTLIPVNADIIEEKYDVLLSIDEYEAEPGDTLSLLMNLNAPVKKLKPLSATFNISLDRDLFYPLHAEAGPAGDLDKAEFDDDNDKLTVQIYNSKTTNIFKQEGNILKILGVALASIPSETLLTIGDIELNTWSQNINFTKDHGKLIVGGFCRPEAAVRDYVLSGTSLQSNQDVFQNKIELKLQSFGKNTVNIEVYNLYGEKILKQRKNLSGGKRKLTISADELSAGTYFLIINDGFLSHRKKILIVK